ncbi:hypothetical protein [Brevundimonas sp.]|uniref:hypothetical protein n=1 Tax=Brevundimonas sp. TaxID=1871086 RepID=UPI002616C2E5|nr:hypothetical protein [Brevundimonas sp.]
MSVHPFPAPVCRPSAKAARPRRPDRVELILVAGLVLATAAQFGLCAWFWLA